MMISLYNFLTTREFLLLICFILFFLITSVDAQNGSPVWSDEFNGTSVDTDNWEFQIGNGTDYDLPDGWGNNELQYYREENASVEDGYLSITAKEENFGGKSYTSARLRTKNKADFLYGKIEARIMLPTGQGMWSAFWMLPTDQVYGGWAASGEIDILEATNIPTEVRGTIHYGGEWPANVYSTAPYTEEIDEEITDFSDDFHVYTLLWDTTEIRWYVDGNHFSTKTYWYSTGGEYPAPFDKRFHLLLNLAVGGTLPGPPDQTTVFPQKLLVDWIRVYDLADVTGIEQSDMGQKQPDEFILDQNYPNPFNSRTKICYFLPHADYVTVKVYNLLGEEIQLLVNEYQKAGDHTVFFDAFRLSSGIYLYSLQARNFIRIKKMILLQ
jgi:beta-glucanase (GH16 family)